MRLTGEIATGEFAGSWAHVADFAAATIGGLTDAECALVANVRRDYRQLKLYGQDKRVVWQWPGNGPLPPLKEESG